jgi:hypothetical protein
MKKQKHSPGPWDVARSGRGELEPFNAFGRHLLSCDAADALPLKERLANARLIASAPDLLDALQRIRLGFVVTKNTDDLCFKLADDAIRMMESKEID